MQVEPLFPSRFPTELGEVWNRLCARAPGPTFQAEAGFLAAWTRHLKERWRPLVLLVHDQSRVAGIVPLMYLDERRRRILPYRYVRFLGWTWTDFSTVLADAKDVPAVMTAALDWLYSGAWRWERLVLDDLVEDHPAADAIRAWLERRSVPRVVTQGRYYYVDLARPWDEVWQETSRRFVRKNFNLARNRMGREGPWSARADPGWDADRVVLEARPIHVARQRELGRESFFEDSNARAFLKDVVGQARAAGTFRSYWLGFRDRYIAYMLGFEHEGVYYAWNQAFDPAFARFYPSRVLQVHVLKDCHARGLREFSFMRGEAEYKEKWTRHARANWRFTLRNSATVYGRAVSLLDSLFAPAPAARA